MRKGQTSDCWIYTLHVAKTYTESGGAYLVHQQECGRPQLATCVGDDRTLKPLTGSLAIDPYVYILAPIGSYCRRASALAAITSRTEASGSPGNEDVLQAGLHARLLQRLVVRRAAVDAFVLERMHRPRAILVARECLVVHGRWLRSESKHDENVTNIVFIAPYADEDAAEDLQDALDNASRAVHTECNKVS